MALGELMSSIANAITEVGKAALETVKKLTSASNGGSEFPNMFGRPDSAEVKPFRLEDIKLETPSASRSEYPSMFEKPEGAKLQTNMENINEKKYYYDDTGNLYRVDNELLPNNNYDIKGYKYETDENGRITSVEGELHLKDRDGRLPIKDSIEDIGKGDQMEGDDRGHLIADRFDGANGLENMIPQDAKINRNDFRNFENQLAEEVKKGKEVSMKIEPVYDGHSRRPTDILVTYTIDEKENVRVFSNSKEDF